MEKREGGEQRRAVFSEHVLLDHYQKLAYHLEQKANWLISTSSVTLAIVVTRYDQISSNYWGHIGALVLIAGCLLSIFNLMFILVPRVLPSKRHIHALSEINLFEYRNMTKRFTKEQFLEYMAQLRTDDVALDIMLSNAIFQITTIRLPSLARKLKIGGWTLLISLFIGSILIVIGFF